MSAIPYPKLWGTDILQLLKYQIEFQIKWFILSYAETRLYFLEFYGIKIITEIIDQ